MNTIKAALFAFTPALLLLYGFHINVIKSSPRRSPAVVMSVKKVSSLNKQVLVYLNEVYVD